MARVGKLRPGPIGVALTLYDVWRRLPPKQRKQFLELARKYGPRAAAKLMQLQRAKRGRG
jgi:TRAP-type C4-dicarboxylate transport system substrate-binding protein